MVVGVLGFFALMRWLAWDALEPLAVVNALTMVAYLPAWFVAVGAILGRRWLLLAGAAAIAAAQLVYVMPELLAATPLPSWTRNAPTLRLLDANVDKSKAFQGGYGAAIARFQPDVVTMEEFTPGSLKAMRRSGALARFPYRCSAPLYGPNGFLVASRLPITACEVHTVTWNGRAYPCLVSATLNDRFGAIQLLVVHTLAPFPAYWPEWVRALDAVDAAVRSGSTGRTLMVGDFNATWDNKGFATLLSRGLTDAAAARGQALSMTWPNGALVPPFARIDHILTGSQLAVTALSDHPGFGSDHRFLTAIIALRTR